MPVDMKLFVHGVRGDAPVVIDVLAWSGGAYGPGDEVRVSRARRRRGRRVGSKSTPAPIKKKGHSGYLEAEAVGGDPADWDVSKVEQWLESIGHEELIGKFREECITGEALLLLQENDLKDLSVQRLGTRKILYNRLDAVRHIHQEYVQERDSDVQHQDISITAFMDAPSLSGAYLPLVEGTTLPECVLVCYEGIRRPGGYGGYGRSRGSADSADIKVPMGTPYWLQKMHEVTISSWSTGGSGGEDRFTLNMTLSFQSLSQSFLGVHARKSNTFEEMVNYMNFKQWEDRERFTDAWESKDPLAVAPGITVWVDTATQKYTVFEFGVHVRWSTASHRIWANEFKDIVKATVLCHATGENSGLSNLPDYLLHHIFSLLSLHYNLDPFEGYPYPDQEALREAIVAEAEDATTDDL